jgi:potassium/hydrogen antiporter
VQVRKPRRNSRGCALRYDDAMSSEPFSTAGLFVTIGLLLAVAVLASRLSGRFGLPFFLLPLGLGMLAGIDGPGGIAFDNYHLSFQIGCAALALILFDGGLNTSHPAMRSGLAGGSVLATLGVVVTAAVMALLARLFGLPWPLAFLLGAIVSSTDGAAVFAALRAGGLTPRRRLASTLEVESGLNDPVAVLLTLAFVEAAMGTRTLGWELLFEMLYSLGIGLLAGLALGRSAAWLLARLGLAAGGLFTVLSLALVLLAFGLPTLIGASGFLAVYAAGYELGQARFRYRPGLLRFHDAGAWISQVGLFLLLGLLATPGRLPGVAREGLALGLLLPLVARPIAVGLCLFPFGFRVRELLFLALTGLRGAVPIVLAIFPVLAGVPGNERLFDIVFFVVLVGAVVPGAFVEPLGRKLGLESLEGRPPRAVVEIFSTDPLEGEILSFHISPALVVAGAQIRDVPFPEGAYVVLIVRGTQLLPPRGSTTLAPGDHVHVFVRPQDRPLVDLLFGHPEAGPEES